MQLTIKEFAKKQQIPYVMAHNVVGYLVEIGQAAKVGKKTSENGKGKPSTIFEIPSSFTFKLEDK